MVTHICLFLTVDLINSYNITKYLVRHLRVPPDYVRKSKITFFTMARNVQPDNNKI